MEPGSTQLPEGAAILRHALKTCPPSIKRYLDQADRVALIAGGGSDRRFYRISGSYGSVIVLHSSPEDTEFQHYHAIGSFLRSLGVRAPEQYDICPEAHVLVMEDVGDTSLQQVLKKEPSTESMLFWYQRALSVLAFLQVKGRNAWESCPRATERTFDYAALRWETHYFSTAFVKEYCSIDPADYPGLDKEFDFLARCVAAEPLFLMHRDFQSQNIMVHNNHLRVLDFQGARRGLLHYDLASLLKDAYVWVPPPVQEKLIDYYIELLCDCGVAVSNPEEFCMLYRLAGLQRSMQALGAFAFLSRKKGKIWFEQYIPPGLHHLSTALKERKDFPVLGDLVQCISDTLSG